MKRLIYLILAVFIVASHDVVSFKEVLSFAAISGEALSDNVIDSAEQERLQAKQEYQIYKQQKESERIESKKKALNQVRTPMALEEDPFCSRSKNDVMTGIALILVAVILSIYLHQLSKKPQAPYGEIYKKTRER